MWKLFVVRIELHAISIAAATGLALGACGSNGDNAGGQVDASAGEWRFDSGARDAASKAGDAGDGLPPGAVPPNGRQLVSTPNAQIDGVTSDGYAAYTDITAGTVNAVSLLGGAPIVLGAVDEFNEVFVKGRGIFFAPTETGLGVAELSVWTSASPKAVPFSASAAVFYSLVAISADGTKLLFFDDIDADAVGSLIVVNADGSGRTKLVTGVELANGACRPTLAFAGEYAIASYCTVPVLLHDAGSPTDASSDARAPDAAAPDAGALDAASLEGGPLDAEPSEEGGPDGDAPDGETSTGAPQGDVIRPADDPAVTATVSSFLGPDWKQNTIATGVQSRFAVDPNGTELLVSGPKGLLWFPIDGAADGGRTIDVAGTYADFVSDGGAVVYTTSSNELERSSIPAPDPTPLSNGLARVIATSPDEKWVVGFHGLDTTTYAVDLYFASATMSGPVSTLVSTVNGTTGGAFGDSFTADSSRAIFFTDVGPESGTLHVAALSANPGAPSVIAPDSYAAYATRGSWIVFNDAYDPTTERADIVAVDTANPTAQTTLVSEADAQFYMTAAKDQIVYSWRATTAGAGIWVIPAL